MEDIDLVRKLSDEAYALHAEQRDWEALRKLEEALRLGTTFAAPEFLKGIIALSHGDYKTGWPLFELRHQRRDVHPFCFRHLKLPMWDGKPTHKRVLIWGSEGLGDTIQMLRFLPEVVERCPYLQMEVQFPLYRLTKINYPNLNVVTIGDAEPQFDLQCSILSLPWVLEKDDIQKINGDPHLRTHDILIEDWKFRKPMKVHLGLCWRGNPNNTRDQVRSMPVVGGVQALANAFDFIPLQREHTLFDDVADMAGLIQNLDAVVTVDTAVAHLAGAMGKPTHLMLGVDCDWRWLQGRKDSPWYSSIKIYRQEKVGDWSNVINEVIDALRQTHDQVTPGLVNIAGAIG